MLNLHWEIDRITIAYSELKKWDEVIYWSEFFFNLPNNCGEFNNDLDNSFLKRFMSVKEKTIT